MAQKWDLENGSVIELREGGAELSGQPVFYGFDYGAGDCSCEVAYRRAADGRIEIKSVRWF